MPHLNLWPGKVDNIQPLFVGGNGDTPLQLTGGKPLKILFFQGKLRAPVLGGEATSSLRLQGSPWGSPLVASTIWRRF